MSPVPPGERPPTATQARIVRLLLGALVISAWIAAIRARIDTGRPAPVPPLPDLQIDPGR